MIRKPFIILLNIAAVCIATVGLAAYVPLPKWPRIPEILLCGGAFPETSPQPTHAEWSARSYGEGRWFAHFRRAGARSGSYTLYCRDGALHLECFYYDLDNKYTNPSQPFSRSGIWFQHGTFRAEWHTGQPMGQQRQPAIVKYFFDVPGWFLLIAAAYPMITRIQHFRRSRKIREPGVCSKCTYDLTGNVSGICPECGTRASATEKSEPEA